MVKQLYVKFGDPSCIGFFEILCEKKQTNKHAYAAENPTHATAVVVGKRLSVLSAYRHVGLR